MTIKNNSKKGITTIFLIGMISFIILLIYIILYLPFPSFAKIKSLVHYVMIIIVWVVLQIGLIYSYYKLGAYIRRGLSLYKNKIQLWTFKVQNFLLKRA